MNRFRFPHKFEWCREWMGGLLLVLCFAQGFLLLTSCGRAKVGELSGVVQLEKTTDSEGIMVFIPGTQFRALTDTNGAFLIAGIPVGGYTVVAQYDGYEDFRQTVQIQSGQRLSIGPFILQKPVQPQGSITGFITLEGETNHENIVVLLTGTTLTATTNTTGYYQITSIPPGSYQIVALKDNWSPASKNDIAVADGQETQIPMIHLRPFVEEPSPTPLPPTLGEYVLQGSAFLEGGNNHTGIRIALEDMPDKYTITDATGFFQLTGLDEKSHTLILSHEGYLDEKIPSAIPVAATSTATCGFVTLPKEFQPEMLGVLQGRIYLEGQEKHDNITVQLEGISPPVFTDSEGRYKFVGIPADQYILIAEHPGYTTNRLEGILIEANQVALAPDLTLVPLIQEEAKGVGGVVGLALLEGETDQGGILVAIEGTNFTAVTGSDGQYTFEKVPEGAYSLIFTKAEFKNYYLDGVQVLQGQNNALEPVILAKDVEPPYVVDTFPRSGARKIPVDQFVDVIVRFSERMVGASVKQAVIIEPPVEFEAFFDRESDLSDLDTLHLRLHRQPPNPIGFNTRYQVAITPQARTPKGVPLAEPFAFTFSTDGPLIVDSIPRKGESQFFMQTNRKVVIVTNAPVDQTAFERSIRFRPSPDSTPIFEYLPMGMGMQILIDASFKPNTRYRIQFDNSMRTVDRQRFSNVPFSLSFKTVYDPSFDQMQPGQSQSMRRRVR